MLLNFTIRETTTYIGNPIPCNHLATSSFFHCKTFSLSLAFIGALPNNSLWEAAARIFKLKRNHYFKNYNMEIEINQKKVEMLGSYQFFL